MNKKYTINNIEVTAEQIKDIIKNNPELLEEKKVSSRYFFPKMGESYYTTQSNGVIFNYAANEKGEFDKGFIELGVYRTKEEAELARDKQKAIVACWKWAEENAPFEPDWEDGMQRKYYAYFGHDSNSVEVSSSYRVRYQFTLPYFKTLEDGINFIEANKANLELLFTK